MQTLQEYEIVLRPVDGSQFHSCVFLEPTFAQTNGLISIYDAIN